MTATRSYRLALAGLCLAQVALVWALPVLPAQDLPQHLAYARIFVDHGRPDLPFGETFVLPERFQSYFTVYYVMAALGRVVSVEAAARVLFTLYVLGVFGGFHALVTGVHRGRSAPSTEGAAPPPWTALLATAAVWSPVACLGFLQFMLAVPVFLLGVAALIRRAEAGGARGALGLLALAGAALGLLHAVAAGAFALFAVLYAAVTPARRRTIAAAVAAVASVGTFAIASALGDSGLGSFAGVSLDEALRRASGLDFLDELFRVTWLGPTAKLSVAAWIALGPYRPGGLLIVALLAAATIRIVRRAHGAARRSTSSSGTAPPGPLAPRSGERGTTPDLPPPPRRRPLRRAAIAFAIAGALCPWGLHAPTEITFLDLRILTLAFPLLLVTVDPCLFAPLRAHRALIAFTALTTLHFGYRAVRYQFEAADALGLLRHARPPGTLMSLVFHDRSDHFARQFRLTHFLPMYHLIRSGGLATQFWARYTHHLPIDYREGRRPARTPDWRPWEFEPAHLRDADHLLLQRADDADDPAREREGSRRAQLLLETRAARVACRGLWCLYRVSRADGRP